MLPIRALMPPIRSGDGVRLCSYSSRVDATKFVFKLLVYAPGNDTILRCKIAMLSLQHQASSRYRFFAGLRNAC